MKFKTDEPVYRKVGRRYKEIGKLLEFDIYPFYKGKDDGSILVVFHKGGGASYCRDVDMDKASVLSAMKVAQRAMGDAMLKASELQPTKQSTPITQEQRDLLDKLRETGFNTSVWTRESIAGIIRQGMDVLEGGLEDKDE